MGGPDYGNRAERRLLESRPASRRDPVDWIAIGGAILWLLAVLADIPAGVIFGSSTVFFGLAVLLGGTPLEAAVTPLALIGTPCVFVGLTVGAAATWARGHIEDRNRQRYR
jgi:hypothetical protein